MLARFRGPVPNDHRELTVQLWYPTQKNQNSARAPYVPGTNFAPAARFAHLSPFFAAA